MIEVAVSKRLPKVQALLQKNKVPLKYKPTELVTFYDNALNILFPTDKDYTLELSNTGANFSISLANADKQYNKPIIVTKFICFLTKRLTTINKNKVIQDDLLNNKELLEKFLRKELNLIESKPRANVEYLELIEKIEITKTPSSNLKAEDISKKDDNLMQALDIEASYTTNNIELSNVKADNNDDLKVLYVNSIKMELLKTGYKEDEISVKIKKNNNTPKCSCLITVKKDDNTVSQTTKGINFSKNQQRDGIIDKITKECQSIHERFNYISNKHEISKNLWMYISDIEDTISELIFDYTDSNIVFDLEIFNENICVKFFDDRPRKELSNLNTFIYKNGIESLKHSLENKDIKDILRKDIFKVLDISKTGLLNDEVLNIKPIKEYFNTAMIQLGIWVNKAKNSDLLKEKIINLNDMITTLEDTKKHLDEQNLTNTNLPIIIEEFKNLYELIKGIKNNQINKESIVYEIKDDFIKFSVIADANLEIIDITIDTKTGDKSININPKLDIYENKLKSYIKPISNLSEYVTTKFFKGISNIGIKFKKKVFLRDIGKLLSDNSTYIYLYEVLLKTPFNIKIDFFKNKFQLGIHPEINLSNLEKTLKKFVKEIVRDFERLDNEILNITSRYLDAYDEISNEEIYLDIINCIKESNKHYGRTTYMKILAGEAFDGTQKISFTESSFYGKYKDLDPYVVLNRIDKLIKKGFLYIYHEPNDKFLKYPFIKINDDFLTNIEISKKYIDKIASDINIEDTTIQDLLLQDKHIICSVLNRENLSNKEILKLINILDSFNIVVEKDILPALNRFLINVPDKLNKMIELKLKISKNDEYKYSFIEKILKQKSTEEVYI